LLAQSPLPLQLRRITYIAGSREQEPFSQISVNKNTVKKVDPQKPFDVRLLGLKRLMRKVFIYPILYGLEANALLKFVSSHDQTPSPPPNLATGSMAGESTRTKKIIWQTSNGPNKRFCMCAHHYSKFWWVLRV
jgi:hypothetical protein